MTKLTDEFLKDFGKALEDFINSDGHCFKRVISFEKGSKYIRVVCRYETGDHGYVHHFLDKEGNIYKSASWRAPAKHIRGSVFDDNYSIGKALGNYGAAYLR